MLVLFISFIMLYLVFRIFFDILKFFIFMIMVFFGLVFLATHNLIVLG